MSKELTVKKETIYLPNLEMRKVFLGRKSKQETMKDDLLIYFKIYGFTVT